MNLPEEYRDGQIVEAVKALGDNTVHFEVNYVSDRRPDTFPESLEHYSFHNYKGNCQMKRIGSG